MRAVAIESYKSVLSGAQLRTMVYLSDGCVLIQAKEVGRTRHWLEKEGTSLKDVRIGKSTLAKLISLSLVEATSSRHKSLTGYILSPRGYSVLNLYTPSTLQSLVGRTSIKSKSKFHPYE